MSSSDIGSMLQAPSTISGFMQIAPGNTGTQSTGWGVLIGNTTAVSAFGTFQGYDEIKKDLPNVGDIETNSSGSGAFSTVNIARSMGVGSFFGKLLGQEEPVLSPNQTPIPMEALFASTQVGQWEYHSHPVIQMAVLYMKKSLDQTWRDKSVRTLCFPTTDFSTAPSSLSVAGLDESIFRRGALGLLVKALYNSNTDQQDRINVDKAASDIQSLNNHIDSSGPALLIQFYSTLFSISPSPENVTKYKKLLLFSGYRTLKMQQAEGGNWPNSNIEMYCHFAKLAACGATDSDIQAIYAELTTVTPILKGGVFGEITPDAWKSYRRWISSGILDYGDLGRGQYVHEYVHTENRTVMGFPTFYMASFSMAGEFCSQQGYGYTAFSSCFAADTKVMISSSGETRRISELGPGDMVVAPQRDGNAMREIAFISKPSRAGRLLYSLSTHSGIRFTDTHPVIIPSNNELRYYPGTPTFVDKDAASSLNPTWHSCITENLDPQLLVKHELETSADEELYDIVFTPSADKLADTYLVVADDGKTLTVGSEAPNLTLFPIEVVFFRYALGYIARATTSPGGTTIQSMLSYLDSPHCDARGLLVRDLNESIEPSPEYLEPSEKQMQSIMEYTLTPGIPEVAEALIGRLGRMISHDIHNGWAPTSTSSTGVSNEILLLNTIRLLDGDSNSPHPPQIGETQDIMIFRGDELAFAQTITGSRQGSHVNELYFPANLDMLNDVALDWKTRSTSTNDTSTVEASEEKKSYLLDITLVLSDQLAGLVWVGGGPLALNAPNIISLTEISDDKNYKAVVEIELRQMSPSELENHAGWTYTRMSRHAAKRGLDLAENWVMRSNEWHKDNI